MDFIEKYKNRLKRSGNNVGEVYKTNTIAFMEATFDQSPTFRVLGVKSYQFPTITQMDARIIEIQRMGNIREVIFRPNQSLDIGSYVMFDGDTWLIFDKYGDSGSTVKVVVAKCNNTLKWKDKDGNIIEIDCVAGASDLGSKAKQGRNDIENNKYDVRLPTGQLYVFVEANPDTRQIELNQRFIFGQQVYEVYGIDDATMINKDGFGIIQLIVKKTTKRDEDDFVNRIAFNRYESEDTGGGFW